MIACKIPAEYIQLSTMSMERYIVTCAHGRLTSHHGNDCMSWPVLRSSSCSNFSPLSKVQERRTKEYQEPAREFLRPSALSWSTRQKIPGSQRLELSRAINVNFGPFLGSITHKPPPNDASEAQRRVQYLTACADDLRSSSGHMPWPMAQLGLACPKRNGSDLNTISSSFFALFLQRTWCR